MIISAISSTITVTAISLTTATASAPTEPETTPDAAPADGTVSTAPETEGTDTEPSAPDGSCRAEQRGRGVLEKLLAGHYHDRAAERLRANFREELLRLQQRQDRLDAAQAGEDLLAAVSDRLATATETLALSEEQTAAVGALQASFEADVKALLEAYTATESGGGRTLVKGVRTAFQSLVAGLEDGLTAPAPPAGETSLTAPAEPVTEAGLVAAAEPVAEADLVAAEEPATSVEAEAPAQSVDAFLSALRRDFRAEFRALIGAVGHRGHHARKHGARGHDRAYSKLVALYQER